MVLLHQNNIMLQLSLPPGSGSRGNDDNKSTRGDRYTYALVPTNSHTKSGSSSYHIPASGADAEKRHTHRRDGLISHPIVTNS